ncbi:hypothetical protein PMZ80_011050 [Knufia obscura]|uniref:Uncharacterized protein n=2 Tax=Knufia TaxID=430999 RepID=A0AAN8I292_9EURO|nr:hypothetical protein PMZ80_011050 [Knufia obscura]KAK5948199.1 hypothetical protein OHC33_010747 [Knufia fluminis]
MYSLIVLGALAGSALAQSAISFSNTTFTTPVVVDAVWPISFTAGNNEPVAIAFGNETYAFQIVDGLTAPGTYNWDVKVPVNVVDGLYQLALMQGDSDPVFSPTFQLTGTTGAPTTDAPTTDIPFPTATATETTTATTTSTVTAIYLPGPNGELTQLANGTTPMVTYIFYDDACACHQTSSCAYTELPASMSSTTVTYSEAACGCTTTVEAPCAETVIPVAPVAAPAAATDAAPATPAAPAAATNTPMMPSSAPAAAVAPASASMTTGAMPAYTGGAGKLAGSGFGLAAFAAGLAQLA